VVSVADPYGRILGFLDRRKAPTRLNIAPNLPAADSMAVLAGNA
jgi:hypothetical protein